ncbi:unnamed protein product [Echinostoma caproni]|uniref:8 kDa glycoprotein n=1 Tax=Echinostoma caproni TaxID=27848 RepID=A0A183AJH5_9TREM|nr:unnamed protein product [Echinostoma caproni]
MRTILLTLLILYITSLASSEAADSEKCEHNWAELRALIKSNWIKTFEEARCMIHQKIRKNFAEDGLGDKYLEIARISE